MCRQMRYEGHSYQVSPDALRTAPVSSRIAIRVTNGIIMPSGCVTCQLKATSARNPQHTKTNCKKPSVNSKHDCCVQNGWLAGCPWHSHVVNKKSAVICWYSHATAIQRLDLHCSCDPRLCQRDTLLYRPHSTCPTDTANSYL